MVGHIVAAVVKKVAKEAVKQVVKTVSKEAKKAIIKKAGQLAKKGMKTAAKKKARQVIKEIEKVGKGAKKAAELIKNTKDFLSDVPKNLKDKALGEFKDFASQYKEGQAAIDALDMVKNVSSKVSNPKSTIKSVVKDFLKQAEEDDKKLEDKDETDDLPFDSPEETETFQVDETPEEPDEDIDEMREQSYTISWYDLPDSIKKRPGKLRELLDESSSSSDGTAVQELIENDYESCTLYGLKRFVDEYNVNDPKTNTLIAEAEQAIRDEVRGS